MQLKMTVKLHPVGGVECEDCCLSVKVQRLLGPILPTSLLKLVGSVGGTEAVGGAALQEDKKEEEEHGYQKMYFCFVLMFSLSLGKF